MPYPFTPTGSWPVKPEHNHGLPACHLWSHTPSGIAFRHLPPRKNVVNECLEFAFVGQWILSYRSHHIKPIARTRRPKGRVTKSVLRLVGWLSVALRPQKHRLIRDGSPGRPPRLSHSSWALPRLGLPRIWYSWYCWMQLRSFIRALAHDQHGRLLLLLASGFALTFRYNNVSAGYVCSSDTLCYLRRGTGGGRDTGGGGGRWKYRPT